jgi:hypothetical protein
VGISRDLQKLRIARVTRREVLVNMQTQYVIIVNAEIAESQDTWYDVTKKQRVPYTEHVEHSIVNEMVNRMNQVCVYGAHITFKVLLDEKV